MPWLKPDHAQLSTGKTPYNSLYCRMSESAFVPYVGFGVLMTSKLETNVILTRYVTAITQYVLSKGFIFVFEFRIRRTIKRDANLVGLRLKHKNKIKTETL